MKEARPSSSTSGKSTGYIAFLRGINLGGHKQVKMLDLKRVFESMGFENVKTVLNSGNVLFEARQSTPGKLVKRIEEKLKEAFDHEIAVILRTMAEIRDLVDSNPFRKVNVTPDTMLYVTFLSQELRTGLRVSQESPTSDFNILSVRPGEVISVVIRNAGRGTTEAMGKIEKEFGKRVTTRNWNTVNRILKT